MTQESVTLPREVVEQVLHALWNTAHGEPCFSKHVRDSMASLRAALERPQDHVPDAVSMVPDGWKLVPVEPTQEMLDAYIHMQGRFSSARSDWAAMLAAAPQPPALEQQVEQEPVAVVDFTTEGWREIVDALRTLPDGAQLYTRPQREREPLSTARIDELIEEGIFGGNPYELVRRIEEERGVFMTRPPTDEQILRIVQSAQVGAHGEGHTIARAIEAAHNIK